MSETQTEAPGHESSARGKHRGPAAVSEEAAGSTQGKHRRPAQAAGHSAGGQARQTGTAA